MDSFDHFFLFFGRVLKTWLAFWGFFWSPFSFLWKSFENLTSVLGGRRLLITWLSQNLACQLGIDPELYWKASFSQRTILCFLFLDSVPKSSNPKGLKTPTSIPESRSILPYWNGFRKIVIYKAFQSQRQLTIWSIIF